MSFSDQDINAPLRKADHITLAFQSQMAHAANDTRFYYEPVLSAHPNDTASLAIRFLGKDCRVPLWVSSMTGGTQHAHNINHRLARACGEYGFGMGLGSCRSLLFSDEYLPDFDVRPVMGFDVPLFANLGIAQVEQCLLNNQAHRITEMLKRLQADGLIIHINPMQEWLQPEGDHILHPPIDTIRRFLDFAPEVPLIVKEVGQGMGKESLRALFALPLAAIDFAAYGGTNFARLELLRSNAEKQQIYEALAAVGHTAADMVNFCNEILAEEPPERIACRSLIVSGGVRNFLDGYYYTQKLPLPAIFGQASAFLKYATVSYEALQAYVASQIQGLALAKAFLRVR